MSYLITFFLITLLTAGDDNNLSFNDAINISLNNNPEIIISEQELIKSRNKLSEIKTKSLPDITANLGFSHSSNPALVSTLSGNETYFSNITLNQGIYSFGRFSNAIAIAELDLHSKQEELKEVKLKIIYDAVKAYYDCILTYEFRKVAEDNVKRLEMHLEKTRVLFKNGVLTQYDVLIAEAELAKANIKLVKSNTNIENSKDVLKKKLFLPFDKEIDLKGDLKYEKNNYDLNKCIETALKNRIELRKLQIDERIVNTNKDLINSGLNPNISLTGNFTLQDNRTVLTLLPDHWVGFWGVGIVFNIPISEWFKNSYAISYEDAKLDQIKSNKKKLEIDIENEVRIALRKIKELDEIIGYQKKVLEHAEESLRLARVRYEHGLITNAEVMDVESSFTSAKMNYLEMIYEHNIAVFMLKKIMGDENA